VFVTNANGLYVATGSTGNILLGFFGLLLQLPNLFLVGLMRDDELLEVQVPENCIELRG